MAYGPTLEGGYGATASVIHTDSSHTAVVSIADVDLLFRGDFRREGPDLILTGQDGRHHIIPGYFASEHRAALVAPNGASLSPDVIDLLAGSPAPGQYAQAQPTTAPEVAGKVEKVVGNATAIRNGVSVALSVGDAVYKNDVIQTSDHSSVGISFPDGTALNLVANTRMALNEYSYDSNSTSNSALFSLVEGTFSFVAGKSRAYRRHEDRDAGCHHGHPRHHRFGAPVDAERDRLGVRDARRCDLHVHDRQ